MTATFDTLAVARDMENAGLKREAAEAVATAIRAGQGELATRADMDALGKATKADMDALGKATKADMDALGKATKADMDALGKATKTDMDALRTATQTDIAAVRSDITGLRWIVGINIAISLATLAGVLAMAFRP